MKEKRKGGRMEEIKKEDGKDERKEGERRK